MVGLEGCLLATTNGSIPTGKEGTLSTAFLTSKSMKSISFPFSISTLILPLFSFEVEVTRSTPLSPLRLSSIFRTTPSSISWGEAPGYIIFILIFLESTSGKKDDLRL